MYFARCLVLRGFDGDDKMSPGEVCRGKLAGVSAVAAETGCISAWGVGGGA